MRAVLRLALGVLPLLVVAACSTEIKYQPSFLPVEFSINSNGEIAVTRNHRIVTRVGTFTVAAAAKMDLTAPSSETLLLINHQVGGEPMQTRFRLGVEGKYSKVCVDGRAELLPDADSNAVVVNAEGSTRITIVNRGESCPAPPPPPAPTPGATFTKVSYGKTRDGYAPYHLNVNFVGFKGQDCLITWQTRYVETDTLGDTSGSIRTGILPHDDNTWWVDELMVKAPSGHRRWGTVFKAYCPDNVLLASGW